MAYAAAGCTGSSKAPTFKNGGLNEDRFQIAKVGVGKDKCALYLGVFDGHGGPGASSYLVENFLPNLDRSLKSSEACKGLEEVLHESFLSSDRSLFQDVQALGQQFEQYREERCKCSFYRETPCRCLRAPRSAHEGSTATVVLLTNDRLYCANVGDSEALLVTKSGFVRSTSDGGCREYNKVDSRSALNLPSTVPDEAQPSATLIGLCGATAVASGGAFTSLESDSAGTDQSLLQACAPARNETMASEAASNSTPMEEEQIPVEVPVLPVPATEQSGGGPALALGGQLAEDQEQRVKETAIDDASLPRSCASSSPGDVAMQGMPESSAESPPRAPKASGGVPTTSPERPPAGAEARIDSDEMATAPSLTAVQSEQGRQAAGTLLPDPVANGHMPQLDAGEQVAGPFSPSVQGQVVVAKFEELSTPESPTRLVMRRVEPGENCTDQLTDLGAETMTIADTPIPDLENEDYLRVRHIAQSRVRRKPSKTRSNRNDGIRRGPSARFNYVALEGAHSLNMTRAFGNFGHKVYSDAAEGEARILEQQSPIIVRPHINIFEPAFDNDFLFVVVASDGLWDNLSKDEVTVAVRSFCYEFVSKLDDSEDDVGNLDGGRSGKAGSSRMSERGDERSSPLGSGGRSINSSGSSSPHPLYPNSESVLAAMAERSAEDLLAKAIAKNRKLDDITVVVVMFQNFLEYLRS